jgi:hypothetical protein
MDRKLLDQIISIIDDVDDMTIATIRPDGYPQATTVSYVNDGLAIYFGTSEDSQKAANIAASDKVSLTINREYGSWEEIEGLSIGGVAVRIDDPAEQQKVGGLLFEKFPQISQYVPEDADIEETVLYRIDPQVISLLDYTKGFGHTELVRV